MTEMRHSRYARDWVTEPPTDEELAAFAKEPLCLRFDTVHAALDYACGVMQEGHDIFATHNLYICKLDK